MEEYEEWKKDYYTKEIIDLKKYLADDDFKLINELGISVLEKLYTESEFENLYSKLLEFYNEDRENDIDNLSFDYNAYKKVIEKFEKISEEFDF